MAEISEEEMAQSEQNAIEGREDEAIEIILQLQLLRLELLQDCRAGLEARNGDCSILGFGEFGICGELEGIAQDLADTMEIDSEKILRAKADLRSGA